MYKNVTQEDIDFIAGMYDPVCFKECLFPENIKAPHLWINDDTALVKIRNYQFSWQPYGNMFCPDSSLTTQENLNRKILASECFNIGARNTGKSFDFIQMDVPMNIALSSSEESCCGAGTQGFLTKVMNPVLNLWRSHPFFKLFHLRGKKDGILGGNEMEVSGINGHTFYGRSENIDKPESGTKFHGLHYDTFFYEEIHYATEKGEEKRIDSGRSAGYIKRFSGIPDVRIGSVLGKILSNKSNKAFICRYPQLVRSDWNEQTKKERVDEYNGESNLKFKLNVLGEKIEGAESFWDIERIKKVCLNTKRRIKHFDIGKSDFLKYKNLLIVDRLPAKHIYICADIGAGARPTEIIIVFYNGKKYRVEYNISLNKLSAKEQAEIFAYLYNKLGGAFIGLDATTDYGIKTYLVDDWKIPESHVHSIDLRKNIPVAFEKDKDGNILRDRNGKDIIKQKIAIDFAMERLENLMYGGKFDLALDNKFFKEFSGFKVLQSGTRKSYDSSTTDDYHQSIPKDEVITCKINDTFVCDKIEDIYNRTDKVSVPTYDNGTVVWKNGRIFRERNKTNKILEFKFRPSSNLRVTQGHSVLVWDSKEMKLKQKLAKDVIVGDLMLSVNNFRIKEQKKYLYKRLQFFHEKRHTEVNKNFRIDEKFAYLLGWCCAEGSKSGNNAYQISLGLKDPYNKIQKLIFEVFGVKSRIDIRPPRVVIVVGGGRNLSEFIEEQIGKLARNKKVPEIILNSKYSVQEAFFKGLIEGDGTKDGKLTTVSRVVANSYYSSLINRNKRCMFSKIINKFGSDEYYIKEATRLGFYNNIPYKALPYDYKSENKSIKRQKIKEADYSNTPRSKRNKEILELVKDFNFIEVKDIREYEYNDYVYDVEVEDTHNFVAGVGNIVVHNSFQIFSITQWFNEFEVLRNKNNTNRVPWAY